MKLNDFIFIAQAKIVLKPEAAVPFQLTEEELEKIIERGETELWGTKYRLQRDINSIIGRFTQPISQWVSAYRGFKQILTGLINIGRKKNEQRTLSQFLFRNIFVLPFRWALQAKHKMFWASKKRALYSVFLSVGEGVKALYIFLLKLWNDLSALFGGIIPVVKKAIDVVVNFISSFFGIPISAYYRYIATGLAVTAAIGSLVYLITNSQQNYQSVIDSTQKAVTDSTTAFGTDTLKTVETFQKSADTHAAAMDTISSANKTDLDGIVKSYQDYYVLSNLKGPPGGTALTASITFQRIVTLMMHILDYIFGVHQVSRSEDGNLAVSPTTKYTEPKDALYPVATMMNLIDRSKQMYDSIVTLYRNVSNLILRLEAEITDLLMSATKDTPIEIKRAWERALVLLDGTVLLSGVKQTLDARLAPHEFQFSAMEIAVTPQDLTQVGKDFDTIYNTVQQEEVNLSQNTIAAQTTPPKIPQKKVGGGAVKTREQIDKKIRRFRNLQVQINGEIELNSLDQMTMDNFSHKLSQYIEKDVQQSWA